MNLTDKNKKMIKKEGFTLIELLVVVLIIGVLAGIVVTVLKPQVFFGKGRDAQRKSDIQSVRAAIEIYAVSQVSRTYPVGPSYSDLATPLSDYLDAPLPHDPKAGWTDYSYSTNAGHTCFLLSATLESQQDPDYPTYSVRGGKGTGCP